ncbi:MAG: hypothetical protein Tsb0034_03560 [Ekhidna sp.]
MNAMKKLLSALLIIPALFFGCEGPPGVPGRDGLDGLNGEESFVFEYEFSFTAPDYSVLLNLPEDFTMLDSDVMLVYLLWEVTNDGTEVWRSLAQTLYLNDGVLSYNYDFSLFDASIFLDGTINLNTLGADFTDNWIARVVVVPAQYANGRTSIDFNNYDEVKAFYDLSPSALAKKGYIRRPESVR